jgi:hypothetical protein
MSSATSFYATFQQLFLSMGVCAGAGALHLSMLFSRHFQPGMAEFTTAFLLVNAVAALSVFWNAQFAADAGDGLTGRSAQTSPPSRTSA